MNNILMGIAKCLDQQEGISVKTKMSFMELFCPLEMSHDGQHQKKKPTNLQIQTCLTGFAEKES